MISYGMPTLLICFSNSCSSAILISGPAGTTGTDMSDDMTGRRRGSSDGRENPIVRRFWTLTACDIFNLTFRPGLIMPQTSDDWILARRKWQAPSVQRMPWVEEGWGGGTEVGYRGGR